MFILYVPFCFYFILLFKGVLICTYIYIYISDTNSLVLTFLNNYYINIFESFHLLFAFSLNYTYFLLANKIAFK